MAEFIDHDDWNPSIPKLPKAPLLHVGPIHGVLPFDGVRNPSARSAVSHKVFMTYMTAANDWQPKVGICESGAEAAVALEALVAPNVHDVRFQPVTVSYTNEEGRQSRYTHDLLITFTNGHSRLIFVRNEASLVKPRTARNIRRIIAASMNAADDLLVVNASNYTRQRRENLYRMFRFVFEPDPEADEITLHVARKLTSLWVMRDLFPAAPIEQRRVFRSCYRLVARRQLHANLDHVFWEHSKIEVAG